ncbi:cytochrome C [Chryseobacterium sp. G0186]|uniref:c-type cytochrome n=1 Tax=Chryseobacterium sp. G0186 TaxID=2487064 RepID=UPI000F4F707F|nr:c-type cytochrome [Chryseobacterium sp. G0186]AZA76158.1 cytochrome C [Chryseobacterium sp. G0186]
MKIPFLHTGIILAFSVIVLSCSKTETTPIPIPDPNAVEQPAAPVEPVPESVIVSSNTSNDEGLKLIEGTDCLTCHKVDSKLIGPSYQEVAKKYTDADLDMLAQKIIEGGKGNWGDIPMTPHDGLSKDNAKLMVKYILSLKK